MQLDNNGSLARRPIVVADRPEAFDVLRATLPGGVQLASAATLAEARNAVRPDTPLVVCGCHFDDGRMYDLLRYLQAHPPLARVPFLTIRALEGELDDAMYESVKIATQALGGVGFVDLYRWGRRYGEAEASRRLTERILALADGQVDSDTTM
jgi:hypothetical protein